MSFARNVPSSVGKSGNWSGYASTSGTFTSVISTWTIPSVTGSGHTSADATWVGIGGIISRDLIQVGTQNIINSQGNITTLAFYEELPYISQDIPITVKAGDSITATLTQQSKGTWLITFNDNSTGQNYQTTILYASSYSSAEWIEEEPISLPGLLPLDNFGVVSFSNGAATQNGNQQSISSSGAKPITMINSSGQNIAIPSSIGSDGVSFTVTRTTAASNTPISKSYKNTRRFRLQGFSITGTPPANYWRR